MRLEPRVEVLERGVPHTAAGARTTAERRQTAGAHGRGYALPHEAARAGTWVLVVRAHKIGAEGLAHGILARLVDELRNTTDGSTLGSRAIAAVLLATCEPGLEQDSATRAGGRALKRDFQHLVRAEATDARRVPPTTRGGRTGAPASPREPRPARSTTPARIPGGARRAPPSPRDARAVRRSVPAPSRRTSAPRDESMTGDEAREDDAPLDVAPAG